MTPATDCNKAHCNRGAMSRGLCTLHYDQQYYVNHRDNKNWNDFGGEQDNYNHETFVQGVASYDIPLDYLPPEGEGDLV